MTNPTEWGTLFQGDARSTNFLDGSFKTIVTSPPYWGLRSYTGKPEEIGTSSAQDYLRDMRLCAEEWRRITTDDAVLWLNLGDSASGSGGSGGDYNAGGGKEGRPRWRQGVSDRTKMQWMNMPHRVLEEFVAAGWLYRACITWEKPHLRRESLDHVRRPGVSHEFIFMLSKGPKYTWNTEALVEKGSVWHFSPAKGKKHSAPFPLELPMRCIPLTTNPGDLVLDPFVGSGTTLEAAYKLDRVGVGLDIEDWSDQ